MSEQPQSSSSESKAIVLTTPMGAAPVTAGPVTAAPIISGGTPASASSSAVSGTGASPGVVTPSRQLGDLPLEELTALAEEYGLHPKQFKTRPHLVAAIHTRRQLIATLERDDMLEVARWGRRPIIGTPTREQLAFEIAQCKSMRFAGLSDRGLRVLALLRGVELEPADNPDTLLRKLKRQEGFFSKISRKQRAWMGSVVAGWLGEDKSAPPPNAGPDVPMAGSSASIKEEIEESGLFGGLAARVKKTADSYINQKLDEIEYRIDRKLDEIDRRLADWRDKEIANRIRILKITLWASVSVAALSLLYSYVRVYF